MEEGAGVGAHLGALVDEEGGQAGDEPMGQGVLAALEAAGGVEEGGGGADADGLVGAEGVEEQLVDDAVGEEGKEVDGVAGQVEAAVEGREADGEGGGGGGESEAELGKQEGEGGAGELAGVGDEDECGVDAKGLRGSGGEKGGGGGGGGRGGRV